MEQVTWRGTGVSILEEFNTWLDPVLSSVLKLTLFWGGLTRWPPEVLSNFSFNAVIINTNAQLCSEPKQGEFISPLREVISCADCRLLCVHWFEGIIGLWNKQYYSNCLLKCVHFICYHSNHLVFFNIVKRKITFKKTVNILGLGTKRSGFTKIDCKKLMEQRDLRGKVQ